MNNLISPLLLAVIFTASIIAMNAYGDSDPYYKNSPGCVIDRGNPERTGAYKEKLSDHPKILWEIDVSTLHTPICADNFIVTTPLVAFDSVNGKKVWDASVNSGNYNYQSTYYKKIIYGDKMIMSGGGFQEKSINLIKYNAKTGKLLNQKSLGIGSASELFIYNGVAYISLNNGLVAYDLTMNKIIWKHAASHDNGLSTDGKTLFFGGVYALDIKNGQLLWKDDTFFGASYYTTVGEKYVYTAFRKLFDVYKKGIAAYNKKTGKIIWERYLNDIPGFGKNGYLSNITINNNKLFISNIVSTPIVPIVEPMRTSSAGGGVYALDAQTGELLWHANIGPVSAPISINNILYVGGQNSLYALDEKTGNELWHLKLKDDAINIVPYRNTLFVKIGQMMGGKLLALS